MIAIVHLSLPLKNKRATKGHKLAGVYLILEWNTPIGPKKCKFVEEMEHTNWSEKVQIL